MNEKDFIIIISATTLIMCLIGLGMTLNTMGRIDAVREQIRMCD